MPFQQHDQTFASTDHQELLKCVVQMQSARGMQNAVMISAVARAVRSIANVQKVLGVKVKVEEVLEAVLEVDQEVVQGLEVDQEVFQEVFQALEVDQEVVQDLEVDQEVVQAL